MRNINIGVGVKSRAALKARVAMFDNDWGTQLDEELKRQFHEKTYPKVALMADTSMNIFRRIVRDICTVYMEPATRSLKGAEPAEQEAIDKLFRELRLDQAMQVAHRYAKAATISFIMARPLGAGKVVLRVLTPDQVYVEPDLEDPTKMGLFAYQADITDAKGKPQTIWIVYTSDERWYADAKGRALDKDPRDGLAYDQANTYGIIPAVAFPAEFQIRAFYNENWNRDAAEANLKIGLLSSYMNYLVKTQSFKQITISAENVADELKDQILDPLFPLLLSGGAQATTLDLNTQLGSIDQVIRGKVAAIANNYGISNENFTLTAQAASGFSLKIANQALQDIRKADIPLCASVESELFKVVAKLTGKSDGREIQFNPGEVSWPEEWGTEQSRWDFEFKNGCASPVDYILSRDPQMSRDEAVAYIKLRQAEIRALRPSMSAWELVAGAALAERGAPGAAEGAPAAGSVGLAALAAKAGQEGPEEGPGEAEESQAGAEPGKPQAGGAAEAQGAPGA